MQNFSTSEINTVLVPTTGLDDGRPPVRNSHFFRPDLGLIAYRILQRIVRQYPNVNGAVDRLSEKNTMPAQFQLPEESRVRFYFSNALSWGRWPVEG